MKIFFCIWILGHARAYLKQKIYDKIIFIFDKIKMTTFFLLEQLEVNARREVATRS